MPPHQKTRRKRACWLVISILYLLKRQVLPFSVCLHHSTSEINKGPRIDFHERRCRQSIGAALIDSQKIGRQRAQLYKVALLPKLTIDDNSPTEGTHTPRHLYPGPTDADLSPGHPPLQRIPVLPFGC